MRSLDRRLRYFDIYYRDESVSVDEVREAVAKELTGPGKLLGYRAMQKKIRQEHHMNVPRDLVHAVMYDLDPEGLSARALKAKGKKPKGHFTSKGTNWVHSVDGHDKMMGYKNSTYPLAVYGCIDTASRKILWLRVWVSNSDPLIVGRWYLEYLYETKMISSYIRMDKGTETGIERWWKELHERLEKYFKEHLRWLKEQCLYDPHDVTDRMILAFIMIPMLQRELDVFKDTIWNSHRIRHQKDVQLPSGVPDHIYNFPEEYNLEECGLPISENQLEEAAQHAGVLDVEDDFLEPAFRLECERWIPDVKKIHPQDCKTAYLYLKQNFVPPSCTQ
ncbi:hypothetical protein QZH41_019446 [Actinostola sp. cb2023]|nr:hypothetical protein QZH41_019446 [Actinostola sp. cb2023]